MSFVRVKVVRSIISTVPGHVGSWSLSKTMSLARVPVAGDDIELAPGWSSVQVKRVTLGSSGAAQADLVPCQTDSPEVLWELDDLTRRCGWTRL